MSVEPLGLLLLGAGFVSLILGRVFVALPAVVFNAFGAAAAAIFVQRILGCEGLLARMRQTLQET
jgi:hypothetical protein